ncbi:MAG: hypothetical protein ACI4MS_04845 [Candidatus Coproplasma sp.]
MSELENEVVPQSEEVTESADFDLSEFALGEDDMPVEEVSISEDLSGFAKGFPDWDIHPPKA